MHVVLPEVVTGCLPVLSTSNPPPNDPDLEYLRFTTAPTRSGWRRRWIASRRICSSPAKRLPTNASRWCSRPIQGAITTAPRWGWTHGLNVRMPRRTGGYAVTAEADLDARLSDETLAWPLSDYLAALAHLPARLRADLTAAWGAPEQDPAIKDGLVHFRALRAGKALIALQPERGDVQSRDDDYHDLDRTPRHGYVAFYLWLQTNGCAGACGAHGTLEWLLGGSGTLGAVLARGAGG